MKKKIGTKIVPKKEIKYPAGENPRIEGLMAENSSIQELARSIQNHGLQYPPILRKIDGGYEAIDGDRRLIAVFDILKWKEVEATIWDVDDKLELYYMKLAANWDREDFSSLEKGRFLYAILEEEVSVDGKTIDEIWAHREMRNDYIQRLSDKLAKPKTTISRFISLWQQVPENDRTLVARDTAELRAGKISPSKAFNITRQGRKLKNVEGTWRKFVPKETKEKGIPITVTTKQLEITRRAIDSGQIKSVDQLGSFLAQGTVDDWSETRILLLRSEEMEAAKLASAINTDISKVYRGCIKLGTPHLEELAQIVRDL